MFGDGKNRIVTMIGYCSKRVSWSWWISVGRSGFRWRQMMRSRNRKTNTIDIRDDVGMVIYDVVGMLL